MNDLSYFNILAWDYILYVPKVSVARFWIDVAVILSAILKKLDAAIRNYNQEKLISEPNTYWVRIKKEEIFANTAICWSKLNSVLNIFKNSWAIDSTRIDDNLSLLVIDCDKLRDTFFKLIEPDAAKNIPYFHMQKEFITYSPLLAHHIWTEESLLFSYIINERSTHSNTNLLYVLNNEKILHELGFSIRKQKILFNKLEKNALASERCFIS